jgi:hypothetical protein
VSSVVPSCYALAGFLHEILSPFARKSKSFLKNSGNFIQLLKSVNLHSPDTLIRSDIVCLFINVPVDKALQMIENKLHHDDTLAEWSVLQVEAITELLEVCLRTTYLQVVKFFQQENGMAMGSYLPLSATSIWSMGVQGW